MGNYGLQCSVSREKADRAKSQTQLKRNSALRDACSKLKNDSQNKGKSVEIVWKKDDNKDKSREILVGDQVTFRQNIDDVSGSFLPPLNYLMI